MSQCPPLTTFDWFVTEHNPADNEPHQNRLLDAIFPSFRKLDEHAAENRERRVSIHVSTGGLVYQDRGRERRYAGDRTLDRGRYAALRHPPFIPEEKSALICELDAYLDRRMPFVTNIIDSTVTPAATNSLRAQGLPLPETPHLLVYLEVTELNEWTERTGLKNLGQNFLMFHLRHHRLTIPNTLDLRYPAARDWFTKFFVALERASESMRAHETGIMFPPKKPIHDFFDLVPVLCLVTLGGGSSFLQGIGAWLRSNGVSALVFPSARTDFGVLFENGQLIDSWGWNIVDYRGSQVIEWRTQFGRMPSWYNEDEGPVEVSAFGSDPMSWQTTNRFTSQRRSPEEESLAQHCNTWALCRYWWPTLQRQRRPRIMQLSPATCKGSQ